MIFVFGGIKGGVGKTMIATNIAVSCAIQKKRVLLVDADEQHSATDWATHRMENCKNSPLNITTIRLSGKGLYSEIRKMLKDYDDVIVDVGGRDTTSQRSALSIADVFLTPFRPRSVDLWTIDDLLDMICQIKAVNHKLNTYCIINQADPSGSDNEESRKIILEYPELNCLPFNIGMRKSFANAMSKGASVLEILNPDAKAFEEIKTLFEVLCKKQPICI